MIAIILTASSTFLANEQPMPAGTHIEIRGLWEVFVQLDGCSSGTAHRHLDIGRTGVAWLEDGFEETDCRLWVTSRWHAGGIYL